MILCSRPQAQYLSHKNEIDEAIRRVLDSGRYILGEEVREFEKEFAEYVGVSHGVGVANGTDAILLSLKACGVGVGDEVVTVSHTAVATVSAIDQAGATPVFIDIDPATFTMDPGKLEAALSPRTRGIVPVHLYGHPAHIPEILSIAKDRGLWVIEDCAQAHGALYDGRRVGSWGHAGCFSFFPTKNLGGVGDGGIVVSNDAEFADRVRTLREYGWKERFFSQFPGYNSRLDELQAAILRVKLSHLDRDNTTRRKIADRYTNALQLTNLVLPEGGSNIEHVFHQYVVRSRKRDELHAHLAGNGIGALIHYPYAVHQQPGYERFLVNGNFLPVTEVAVREVLSLPIYPELSEAEFEHVVDMVQKFERAI